MSATHSDDDTIEARSPATSMYDVTVTPGKITVTPRKNPRKTMTIVVPDHPGTPSQPPPPGTVSPGPRPDSPVIPLFAAPAPAPEVEVAPEAEVEQEAEPEHDEDGLLPLDRLPDGRYVPKNPETEPWAGKGTSCGGNKGKASKNARFIPTMTTVPLAGPSWMDTPLVVPQVTIFNKNLVLCKIFWYPNNLSATTTIQISFTFLRFFGELL